MPTPLPSPTWPFARLHTAQETPAATAWFLASVPGAVQLDWARAGGWPDRTPIPDDAAYLRRLDERSRAMVAQQDRPPRRCSAPSTLDA